MSGSAEQLGRNKLNKGILMSNNFYVYGLFEEGNDLPFYIGKGTGDRYIRSSKDINGITHKNNKIRKLINENIEVKSIILADNLSETESLLLEIELIKDFGRICNGGILVNHTDGGDGSSGYKHSDKSKIKMSEIAKSRPHISDETRKKLAIASSNRICKDETREKLSILKSGSNNHMFGKNHSNETKLKMSKSQSGKILTEEHKRKISESNKKTLSKFQLPRGNNPNSKKLVANGINFDCIVDAAKFLDVNRITIRRRIKSNKYINYYFINEESTPS